MVTHNPLVEDMSHCNTVVSEDIIERKNDPVGTVENNHETFYVDSEVLGRKNRHDSMNSLSK